MAKQAYVYSGTDWVPLASEVTNLTAYQTKASNQFAHRNLIINGAMQVAQRGTSVTGNTTGGYLTADRWGFGLTSLGTWTQTVENDAPTGSGFRKSLKMLCTTADASPAAADLCYFYQRIEGQNLQQVKKGTAAAEQLTVSFWVKANVTGTYIARIYDADNTRGVSASYTVSASATWERKTITFPADTTGAFDNDNASSLEFQFFLATGTDYASGTLQTTWSTSSNNIATGQTNLASATSNYWQITGVQLEVGDTATPFEFKPFGEELKECERYYEKSYSYATAPGTSTVNSAYNVSGPTANLPGTRWRTHKRAAPTCAIYHWNGTANQVYRVSDAAAISVTGGFQAIGDTGASEIIIASASSNSYIYHYTASAEL
jgi:hypothetical protein